MNAGRLAVASKASLLLGGLWLALGCAALAGLAGLSEAQLIGWALILPAVPVALVLGAVGAPRVLCTVSDGWPVLNAAGVVGIYLVPGIALCALGLSLSRRTSSRCPTK
jgi:hypothetical protein